VREHNKVADYHSELLALEKLMDRDSKTKNSKISATSTQMTYSGQDRDFRMLLICLLDCIWRGLSPPFSLSVVVAGFLEQLDT
jgi:hypothetical protein